jgi:hypothetical protein
MTAGQLRIFLLGVPDHRTVLVDGRRLIAAEKVNLNPGGTAARIAEVKRGITPAGEWDRHVVVLTCERRSWFDGLLRLLHLR